MKLTNVVSDQVYSFQVNEMKWPLLEERAFFISLNGKPKSKICCNDMKTSIMQ